jgi:putative oxygen-independent coproporphyrinogen III oxidase
MQDNLSIYVHWPFCLSKCPYCDFNSHVLSTVDHNLWLKSYISELDHFEGLIRNKNIKSIFFGGGTPSLMEAFVVEGIINKIASLGTVDHKTEITLEANPTSFETEKFKTFNRAGVNRVSIGVQSLNNDDLKLLGRMHDSSQAIKAIEAARLIFPKISFDLIYARTNQTLKNWQQELTEAINLASGHISLYQLTIEKGTEFFKLFHEGMLTIPGQDEAADMYNWTNSYLESKNYSRYEISNYATFLNESIHNLTYWNYNNYLGIGPGAHSRITEYSLSNTTTRSIMMLHRPDKWLSAIKEFGNAIQVDNILSLQETIEEFFMMGLRLQSGISLDNIVRFNGLKLFDILDQKAVEDYSRLQLVDYSANSIKLTNTGLMLHNYLVPRLMRN